MGVIYKLRPEIRDFILSQKKDNPKLACRVLANLIREKYHTEVSKSSINVLIKEAGLSLSVGRPRKRRRQKAEEIKLLPEQPVAKLTFSVEKTPQPPQEPLKELAKEGELTGAILLRAVDYLLGGSIKFSAAIKKHLSSQELNLQAKTESLIYLPLFSQLSGLWAQIGQILPTDSLSVYIDELQRLRTTISDMLEALPKTFQEARYLKLELADKSQIYLDGQLHTVWPSTDIPFSFSATISSLEGYINNFCQQEAPLILFMAPYADTASKEFFSLLQGLDSQDNALTKLSFYGHKQEEIKSVALEAKKRSFIFGLWPWQWARYRKVKKIGEFRPHNFTVFKKEFFIADTTVELLQPFDKQAVTLRGLAVKNSLNENIKLIILTNLSAEAIKSADLAELYLNRWPNPEESFQDYSRKLEFYHYLIGRPRFNPDSLSLDKNTRQDIRGLFQHYLKILDLYFKGNFLPFETKILDFPSMKDKFYNLKAEQEQQETRITYSFQPPQDFPFLKELSYACHRLNERAILTPDGKRLWFVV